LGKPSLPVRLPVLKYGLFSKKETPVPVLVRALPEETYLSTQSIYIMFNSFENKIPHRILSFQEIKAS
jgi:hypothetical protein